MPTASQVLDKLILACKKEPPSLDHLEACCAEIMGQYQFDVVFVASAPSPEEDLIPLATAGNWEVMEAAIYRLGVEEKTALTRLPVKVFTDITGAPTFNQYGSLRMQKPQSAIFLVYNVPGKEYLLLGCGHQDSRTYALPLIQDMSQLWTLWKELLSGTIARVTHSKTSKNASDKKTISPAPAAAPVLKASSAPPPSIPVIPLVPAAAKDETRPSASAKSRRSTLLVDEVTRLYNRSYFDESLTVEVARAKRYSRNLSLLLLRVGNQKEVSAQGRDQVATHIAEVLIKSLRLVDVICRLSEYEYAIILPDTATNTCGIIGKRVFKYFKQILAGEPSVFINMGAAAFPENSTESKSLFEKATELLEQARQAGPNKAVLTD
ncbi:MAG: diguanylate cyclase [bacterium]